MRRRILLLPLLVCLSLSVVLDGVAEQRPPAFVIFAHGLWGSMDNLPKQDPAWLAASPYPHYAKHQETPYLSSKAYVPIPQKYLKLAEGPSITKIAMQPYAWMQHEFTYWAKEQNRRNNPDFIKIFGDWQVLEEDAASGAAQTPGEINLIYLKFDWRLELPQVVQDYVQPLLALIERRWPGAEIHFIGHSLGALVGRYAVSRFPGVFTSLVSIGGPQYGIYEIGLQRRGSSPTFGGDWDKENSQALGLMITERLFFHTKIVKLGKGFLASAVEFSQRYTPMARWLDTNEQALLVDGFGTMPRLSESVPHAVALYGLGYGSYDFSGHYHPQLLNHKGIGPGLAPGDPESAYAQTGDGRVDPVSARGPFTHLLCLGKDKSHGDLMWSPLVMGMLIDRYFFAGEMARADLLNAMRRLNVEWVDRPARADWVEKARQAW